MKVPFVDRSSTCSAQALLTDWICSLQWTELQRLSSSLMEHDAPRPMVKEEPSNKSMFLTFSGFIEIKRPTSIYYGGGCALLNGVGGGLGKGIYWRRGLARFGQVLPGLTGLDALAGLLWSPGGILWVWGLRLRSCIWVWGLGWDWVGWGLRR